jgi:glutathione synthase/RimK-type ligase-like ATP-grasp enzyme
MHLWNFPFMDYVFGSGAMLRVITGGDLKDAILVLTNSADAGADLVIERIRESNVTVHRFNTESFPLQTSMTLRRTSDRVVGRIILDSRDIVEIETVKSVWHRRPRPANVASITHGGVERFIRDEANAALWSFYTTSDAFWMNPPLIGSALLEHNKLLQLQMAAELGIQVPDTIITNDASELIEFCRRKGGEIAVKLLKGNHFKRASDEQQMLAYTQRMNEAALQERKDAIALAPVFAQEYVEKDYELRITFVAGQLFSCAIYSQTSDRSRTDWRRYDLENVKHTKYDLPPKIGNLLIRLMAKLRLNYGAIDMIRTPDGSYVFLEVNQAGEWHWIEQLTDLPIADAIASALITAPNWIANLTSPNSPNESMRNQGASVGIYRSAGR